MKTSSLEGLSNAQCTHAFTPQRSQLKQKTLFGRCAGAPFVPSGEVEPLFWCHGADMELFPCRLDAAEEREQLDATQVPGSTWNCHS